MELNSLPYVDELNANDTELLKHILSQLPPEQRGRVLQSLGRSAEDFFEITDFYSNLVQNYPEYMVPNQTLRMYVPPVLIIIGTFGNLFSFIILAKSMLKVSTYSYLAVLAVMDLLVLYIGLLRMWIGQFTMDIQMMSNFLCKLVNFLGFVCSDSSVWLIIAVTVERFIAVRFPLRAPRMCRVKRARFVIFGVFLLIIAINAHIFWTVELLHDTKNGSVVPKCDAATNYEVLIKDAWPWVDAAIYSFVPFVVITILNVLIVRQVLYARKRRTKLQQDCITGHTFNGTGNGIVYRAQQKRQGEGSKKLTCMLLTVSFTFLLTTLPMNMFQIVNAFFGPEAQSIGTEEYSLKFAQFSLVRTVVELLMYANHSINFFLYCATGRKFRSQFRILLCVCCEHRPFSLLRLGSKKTTSTSIRLTRFNSAITSSPKSTMLVKCDRRLLNSSR